MVRDNACCVGIVDDDKNIVATYKKVFERHGIPVCLVAYDGREAVRMFCEAERRPAVVIMDERMYIMSGTEATQKLVKHDPKLSIIFLSADADAMGEAFHAGAKIFLRKPISIKVILEAIELACKNSTTNRYYYDGYKGFVVITLN